MGLRIVNRACFDVLIIYAALAIFAKFAVNPSYLPSPRDMGDYRMNLRLSKEVCDQRHYPQNFAYPLPGVLFWQSFGALNFSVGSVIWLFLVPAGMIGSFILARRLAWDYEDLYSGIGMLIAFGVVEFYLRWDLKTANVNSIYLVVVLLAAWCWQREKLIWAGTLLALATAIKIYSIAFLPYILLRREWRLGFFMLAAIAVFFIGIPVLYFGWHDALVLTRQWIAVVFSGSSPGFILDYHAYKVSLTWIAMLLLNPEASGGRLNLVDWNIASISLTLKLAWLAWFSLVAGYFVTNPQSSLDPKYRRLAFTLDISVLLFCFFPASPFLQPHHLVALLVPAVCLARVLFDAHFTKGIRATAGLTLGMSVGLVHVFNSSFRGIGVMLALLIFLAGIWIIRRALRSPLPAAQ